jgi:hypothetical protein
MNSLRSISGLPRLDQQPIAVGAVCLALTKSFLQRGRLLPDGVEDAMAGINRGLWRHFPATADDTVTTRKNSLLAYGITTHISNYYYLIFCDNSVVLTIGPVLFNDGSD